MSDDVNRVKQFMGGNADTSLRVDITSEGKCVQIVFSKPVLILSVSPEQALGMAMGLLDRVGQTAFGKPLLPPPGSAPPLPGQ